MLLGCYVHPDITDASFQVGLQTSTLYAIICDAAASVFEMIGFDEQAAYMKQNVTEQVALLQQNKLFKESLMSASIWAPGSEVVNIDAESTLLSQVFTATEGQVVFTLTQFSYTPSSSSLAVFRNGQKLVLNSRLFRNIYSKAFLCSFL